MKNKHQYNKKERKLKSKSEKESFDKANTSNPLWFYCCPQPIFLPNKRKMNTSKKRR